MTILNTNYELVQFTDSFGKIVNLKHRFHPESRLRYRVDDFESLTEDNYELLNKLIEHHQRRQKPRLIELMNYANGMNHKVSEGEYRRQETDMADNRAIHDFGGMISVFKEGYLTGIPIEVGYEGDKKITDKLKAFGDIGGFDKLNRNLILDMSRVGRAYELVYRRKDDKTIIRKLSPFDTFVIFDNTVSERSIAAVRYYNADLFDDSKTTIELYTDHKIIYLIKDGSELEFVRDEPHGFGKVPITEYLNDNDGFGDYEKLLSLIDLYDAAQSDTANFMTDLADAILAVFGNVDFPDELTQEQQLELQKAMRKARFMFLKPPKDNDGRDSGTVDAKYLTKSYDVQGVESYKTRLEQDIHKFANMPNLSDSNFSGTQSGEALKYKLFGLDQKLTDTEDMMIESLKRRYELLAIIENKLGNFGKFDISKLRITITPNLPTDSAEIINAVKSLYGMVSDETAFTVLHKATGVDANDEIERIKKESSVKAGSTDFMIGGGLDDNANRTE